MFFQAAKKGQFYAALLTFGQRRVQPRSISLDYSLYYQRDTKNGTWSSRRFRIGLPLALGMACSGTIKLLKEIQHHEEAKGFLSHRHADRRGDHSDHRGHRHPEPPPVTYGRERVFGGGFYPHHKHSGSHFCVHLSKRWFCSSDRLG